MEKKGSVFAVIIIIFFWVIVGLSIRGYFMDKKQFKGNINGIVITKQDGSKGSFTLSIRHSFDSSNHVFNGMEFFDVINVGDSIQKNGNSYFVNLYRKNKFIDSFKIGPTGLAFLLE